MLQGVKKWLALEGYYIRKRIHKKYYIIYRSEGGAGFFSNYFWVLGHVVFARKLGYIPVVDMEHYKTLYSETEPVEGEKNAWNYFFENVGEVSLEDAYASGKYVLGRDKYLTKYAEKYSIPPYRFPTDKTLAFYQPYIEKHMKIREEISREFEREWNKKVRPDDHVVGIHIRGTDMKNDLGHPVPAAVEVYLDKLKKLLADHPEIHKIFLATDENNIKERFEEEFRQSTYVLFVNEVFRVSDNGETLKTGIHELQVENPRLNHKYLIGKEVLQDAWFLNQCEYLVCGYSNVTNVVMLWNQGRFKQIICVEPIK